MVNVEKLDNYDMWMLQDSEFKYSLNQSHTLSENYYRSHALPRSNENKITDKGFSESYRSYELIPVKEAIYLRKMLIYALYSKKITLNDTQLDRANRNYRTISAVLNGIEQGSCKFVDYNNKLYLKYNSVYGHTKKYSLGRLYSKKASINQLSKEFRYFLFKEIYQDIYIINAHPTILYIYSKKNGFNFPLLEQLVYDRDMFYQRVYHEYNKSIPKESLKKLTLVCLNMYKQIFKSDSLNMLNAEIVQIKKSLYEEFYSNNSSFKAAIDFRMEMERTHDIYIKMQKVQSLYCYNIETENIIKFKEFLSEKWFNTEISIVPFFDGLFIENINCNVICKDTFIAHEKYPSLNSIIEEYNEKSSIKFKLKKISPDFQLFSKSQYTKLNKAITCIENLTHSKMQQLLKNYGISTSTASILKGKLDHEKSNTEITFSFEDIQDIKLHVNQKYAEFIDCVLEDDSLY